LKVKELRLCIISEAWNRLKHKETIRQYDTQMEPDLPIPTIETDSQATIQPNSLDAVFGSGGDKNKMRHGSLYSTLLEEHLESYHSLNPKSKQQFAREKIVNVVREKGGRFLERRKDANGEWSEIVDDRVVVSKVMQAFRDKRRKLVSDIPSTESIADEDDTDYTIELERRIMLLEEQVKYLEQQNEFLKSKFQDSATSRYHGSQEW
jgi:hypothetical protein